MKCSRALGNMALLVKCTKEWCKYSGFRDLAWESLTTNFRVVRVQGVILGVSGVGSLLGVWGLCARPAQYFSHQASQRYVITWLLACFAKRSGSQAV